MSQVSKLALGAALLLVMSAAGCGGGGSDQEDTPTSGPAAAGTTGTASPTAAVGTVAATSTTAATATTAPTVAPSPTPGLTFNAAKLPTALAVTARVNALLGAGITTLRDKSQDPQQPFSSVPSMGNTLVAQGVQLLYNSYQTASAPSAGRPCAFQNTVQGYPSAGNATTAFTALRTTWQGTVFQNLSQQGDLGQGWQESFSQLGNFVSASGQTTQWYVCMARLGPYVVTVSVGAFPGLDVNSVAQVVRAYFDEAQRTF